MSLNRIWTNIKMELNIEIKIPFGLCLMLRTGVLVLLLCLALSTMALHVFIKNTVDSLVFFWLFLRIRFCCCFCLGFLKIFSQCAVSQSLCSAVTLGTPVLSHYHCATAWLHGDTEQAALLGRHAQQAATLCIDSLCSMPSWKCPNVISPSLRTLQTDQNATHKVFCMWFE